MGKIIVDTSKFDGKISILKSELRTAGNRTVTELARLAEAEMKDRAPVNFGILRGSIVKRAGDKGGKSIYPTASYGPVVERTWKRKKYHGAPNGPPGSGGVNSPNGYIADTRIATDKRVVPLLRGNIKRAIRKAGFRQ